MSGKHIAYILTGAALLMMLTLESCGSKRHVVSARPVGTAAETVTLAYSNDIGRKIVSEARRWIGTRYQYGGHSLDGTDCSGMVMEIYNKVTGIALPRNSAEQCRFATDIRRDLLRQGDLVFFATSGAGRVSHVGIYIGDGRMIHASASKGVTESSLDDKYWIRNYVTSGQILADNGRGSCRPKNDKKKSSKKKMSTSSKSKFEDDDPIYNPTVKRSAEPEVKAPDDLRKLPEIDYHELDDLLNQKVDSVYSSFMD